jgi:hypothetical protein
MFAQVVRGEGKAFCFYMIQLLGGCFSSYLIRSSHKEITNRLANFVIKKTKN